MALVVKNPPANAGDVRDMGSILGREDPLEKEMATQSSILAWRIPWTEEPGGLQSTGSQNSVYVNPNLPIYPSPLLYTLAAVFSPSVTLTQISSFGSFF